MKKICLLFLLLGALFAFNGKIIFSADEDLFPSKEKTKAENELQKHSVGEWSEWQINILTSRNNPVIADNNLNNFRLRMELTSIKEGRFFYTVKMKLGDHTDVRENVEIDFKHQIKNLTGQYTETQDRMNKKEKIEFKLLNRSITAFRENIVAGKHNGENVEKIVSSEYEKYPVYFKTRKVEVRLINFGTGIAPVFPLKSTDQKIVPKAGGKK